MTHAAHTDADAADSLEQLWTEHMIWFYVAAWMLLYTQENSMAPQVYF